jgi:hypothetical protein
MDEDVSENAPPVVVQENEAWTWSSASSSKWDEYRPIQ